RVDGIGPAERVLGRFAFALRALHLLLGRCFPLPGGAHPLLCLLPELSCLCTPPVELSRPGVAPKSEREARDDDDRDDHDDDPDPGAHRFPPRRCDSTTRYRRSSPLPAPARTLAG